MEFEIKSNNLEDRHDVRILLYRQGAKLPSYRVFLETLGDVVSEKVFWQLKEDAERVRLTSKQITQLEKAINKSPEGQVVLKKSYDNKIKWSENDFKK